MMENRQALNAPASRGTVTTTDNSTWNNKDGNKRRERICVATTKDWNSMETFVRTHIRTLPFDVTVLTGRDFDRTGDGKRIGDGRMLTPSGPAGRIERGLGDLRKRWLHLYQSRFLERNGIRAVLGEYGHRGGLGMMRACEGAGVPLIVHFHGFDAYNEVDVVNPNWSNYEQLFAVGAAFIGVSRAMCRWLAELGAPEDRIHYVPSYVDPEQFRQGVPAREPVFLVVGRFVEKKAPHLAIRSFAEARKAMPDARLEMIGDGALLNCCRELAKTLGIADAVTFHGARDHEAVREAMARARCYVQHSVRASCGDSEGTPVALLEAQCSGLPVVATRHAGIPDVVEEGRTGYLVDERDVEAMAEAMIKVGRDYDEAFRLGEAGAARVRSAFGFDQTMGKLAGIIRSTWNQVRK